MAKVSVWLTSYNHGELLRESIESVLNQTYQDFEFIIVDDCSTDHSQEIIKEYVEKYPRIKAILHEKNIGRGGLAEALEDLEGDYVAILHGDDKWNEKKLESQVAVLDSRPEVAACFTGVTVIDDDGNAYVGNHAYANVFSMENKSRYEWLRYFFDRGNCLCHPSLLIRKEVYTKYQLFASGLNSLPDLSQWIKVCFHAEIYIVPEKLTYFRVHQDESNESGETAGKQKRLFLEEYFLYKEYLKIKDVDTLLKIFPEGTQYVVNGQCMIEYALAQLFMKGSRNVHKLIGLELMYEMFQSKEKKAEIEELYGYGSKAFDLDKRKFDIFGLIPREKFLTTTLYWDTGKGYNEEEAIKEKVYVPSTRMARIIYQTEGIAVDMGGKELRFDLDEGTYRRCKVISANWSDGSEAQIEPVNGIRQDGMDVFYTLDPQYMIKMPREQKELKIVLNVEEIPLLEVGEHFKNLESQKQEMERLLTEYRSSFIIRAVYRLLNKKGRERNDDK